MHAHETDVIDRWRRFVREIQEVVLPEHAGRLVKSLGDGLMLEFPAVLPAIEAALEIQRRIVSYNVGRTSDQCLFLRIGAHVADVVIDQMDVYGSGVNLAARLASLANPGEVVVSTEIRDGLVDSLDATAEDMGECFLKHLAEPVRAFRVGAPDLPLSPVDLPLPDAHLEPVIAVLPFGTIARDSASAAVGEMVADTLIVCLSHQPRIRVISALSTRELSGPERRRSGALARLSCNYMLSGTVATHDRWLSVAAELTDVRTEEVVWAERCRVEIADLFAAESELAAQICRGILASIERTEMNWVRAHPLPTLESYSLQMAAVSFMHRAYARDFDRVQGLLAQLIERHPRAPTPRAWMAKWHVLRVTRGLGLDLAVEAQKALFHTQRAVDSDPQCALALAMEGFVLCHMGHDLDAAAERYARAIDANHNESMAWLFKSMLHAFQGEGAPAMEAADRAIALSPLDPLRYYYDSLAASAALSASRYDRAIELAIRSLRANRAHPSTLRVLVIAHALSGDLEKARTYSAELMRLQPAFTVRGFLVRSPAGRFEIGRVCAEALRMAGVPD
jgi:TolB-like protein